MNERRVAVIGAGPIGLEAAHQLAREGFDVRLYEAGAGVGSSVRRWEHVRLFSPWKMNTSELGLEVLRDLGLKAPEEEAFPTGEEFLSAYLEPLGRHPRLEGRIEFGVRVRSVAREGVLKGEWIGSPLRRERPFRLLLERDDGREEVVRAEIVVDTSGTYETPNALGDGGMEAPGERRARAEGLIEGYIPDLRGKEKESYEGKHLVVIGSGYSAITTLNQLLEALGEEDETRITWITRGGEEPYEVIDDDPLPQRKKLAGLGNELAGVNGKESGVEHIKEVRIEAVEIEAGGKAALVVRGGEGVKRIEGVDRILANVGYRPDVELYRELQVHQCYASEGPMKLAAALLGASGEGGGDCLAQGSMGAESLKNPEPDFFILGSKSYGRRSDFLLKLGLEQIEELKTLL